MAHAIIMPKAGMAMEEGTIIRWLKNIGDTISVGDAILEIETDKVSMEVEAEYDGVLLATLYKEGDVVEVVKEIGYIGEKGERVPTAVPNVSAASSGAHDAPASSGGVPGASTINDGAHDISVSEDNTPADASGTQHTPLSLEEDALKNSGVPDASASSGGVLRATPLAKRLAKEHNITLAEIAASGSTGEILSRDVHKMIQKRVPFFRATPLAKKIAAARGVDLATVTGSGPAGRIQKKDVTHTGTASDGVGVGIEARREKAAVTSHGAIQPPATHAIKGVRKIIATRMAASHTEIPAITLTHPVQVDSLYALRTEIHDYLGYKTSLNSWLSYAAVRALYHVPALNCTYNNNMLTLHEDVHLGIAVDSDNGLIVPIIRAVNRLSFLDFNTHATEMIAKARNGTVAVNDLQGGTFTISNLGMYGITHFTPMIPLPQIGILGLTATQKKCIQDGRHLSSVREMNLIITVDHRVIDGAAAARYLHALAKIICHPTQLLL